MHGPRNYTAQVSHGTQVPLPPLQQSSGAVTAIVTTLPPPPPTLHHGLVGSQQQAIKPGNPTFPPPPGSFSFRNTLPGAPRQRPIVPAVSNGVNSGQTFVTQPPAPPIPGQTTNSYPTSEHQHFPWSQNCHQIPQSVPLPVPRGYLPPSSQGYLMERGPLPQTQSKHVPSPQLSLYSSTSSFSIPDSSVSTAFSRPQHSYLRSIGPLPLPPPPAPPPPPPPPPFSISSPPRVPPLASSALPNVSKNSESDSLKVEFPYEDGLRSEDNMSQAKPAKSSEASPAVEAIDANFSHSSPDSDMVMEDDITLPDEEKHSGLSKKLNEECVLLSQEVDVNEQLESSLQARGHRLPPGSHDGNSLNTGFSVSQVKILETSGGNLSDQLNGDANPFELLQGYTSEDSLENDAKNNLGDAGPPSIEHECADFLAIKGGNITLELEPNVSLPSKSMIESLAPDELYDKNIGDQESTEAGIFKALQPKISSRISDVGINRQGGSTRKSSLENNDTKLNVDEFGRLVREGVSDSDTSNSPLHGQRHARRSRKKSRSRSRSRSPHGRRKSPLWRNGRRHKSRSMSPKRRRSRSRSPVSRRSSEYDGNRLKRDKGQFPECFNFLRGKCYRGTSCRFSHHETGQSERLRFSRGKQQYHGTLPTVRSPDFHADRTPERKSVVKCKEGKDKELKFLQKMPGDSAVKTVNKLPVDPTTKISDKSNPTLSVSPLVGDVVARNLSNHSSYDLRFENEDPLIGLSPAQILCNSPQLVGQSNKRTDDSLVHESLPVQASTALSTDLLAVKLDAKEHPVDKFCTFHNPKMESYSVDNVSYQSMNSNELSLCVAKQPYQLSLPLPSMPQVTSAQFSQGIPQDCNSMHPTALVQSQTEKYPLYQGLLSHRPSLISEPSNSSSSTFHPPPQPSQPQLPHPHVTLNAAIKDFSIPAQQLTHQSLLPPRNGLSSYSSTKPYFSELPIVSQTGQYPSYLSGRETDHRSHKLDEMTSNSSIVRNLMNREGGEHIFGGDYVQSTRGEIPSSSASLSQPKSLPNQIPPMGTNAYHAGSFPSTSIPSHFNLRSQSEYYGVNYHVAHSVYSQPGDPGSTSSSASQITSGFLEQNHSSHVQDFVGSRNSTRYSSYSSSFDHPPSSLPTSNALIHETDPLLYSKYGLPTGSSTDPVHRNKTGNVSSTNMISSSTSEMAAGGHIPKVVSEQYDPIFDSIEPAPNSCGIANPYTCDFPRFNEGGAVLSANDSPEIEEYGETEDAGVDAILNGDSGNPHEMAEMNAGESEIDQVKGSGKNKKRKDTRSMTLFKISIASFVKQVLKPSWRQGNMSKEAFKTIVKKTVDKVSSAMKSHKIPKSQAKINHYIESSRGKLTKLVMGYVGKYVKS